MVQKTSPAITFMIQYRKPDPGHVNYTNRKNAVDIDNELEIQRSDEYSQELIQEINQELPEMDLDFEDYVDYMNRGYATKNEDKNEDTNLTTMFTATENNAPKIRLKETKDKLKQAHQNNSLMWQGVVSFDNEFLAKQGLYDPKTGKVNQRAIKETIRQAMPSLMQREGLSDTAFWWGNIHLNTRHVHVHLGISEIESNRPKVYFAPRDQMEYKGAFSQKTIKAFKSTIYHEILNEREKKQLLRQEQKIGVFKQNLTNNIGNLANKRDDYKARFFLEQAYNHFPQNKRLRYRSNAKDFKVAKFYLDKYVKHFLAHDGREDYESFKQETRDYLANYKQAYTSEEEGREYEKRTKDWRNNEEVTIAETKGFNLDNLVEKRIQDLHERLGSKLLNYLQDNPPEDVEVLPPNLSKFSESNQKLAKTQLPEVSTIYTEKQWKKLGYDISTEDKPIVIVRPNNNPDIDKKYVEVNYWDISQVKPRRSLNLKPRIKLYQALWLTTEELGQLVDNGKNRKLTKLEKQEIGIYRHAIRVKNMRERQLEINERITILNDYQPLTKDKPLIDYKLQQYEELQKLIDIRLKPRYKQTDIEKEQLKELTSKHLDVIKVPINKVDEVAYLMRQKTLSTEIKFADQVQSDTTFTLIYGSKTTKEQYLNRLKQEQEVLKTKYDIHQRNEQIRTKTNEDEIEDLKKANGRDFGKLKELYQELDPENEDRIQEFDFDNFSLKDSNHHSQVRNIERNESDSFKQERSHFSYKSFSPHMVSSANLMLKANGREQIEVAKKKWRDDEHTEKERQREERKSGKSI